MRVAVTDDTSVTKLATDARFLVAGEEGLRDGLDEAVDEDVAGLDSAGNALGMLNVLGVDRCTKAGIGIVGASDDLVFVGPRLGRDNGAERLLLDDAAVIWRVVDDSRLDEEALAGFHLWLASCELVTLLLGIGEESLDSVKLHGVLDGSEHDTLLVALSDLEVLGESDHALHELGVDRFVDVDALGGDADLTGVEEASQGHFWDSLVHVDVWENDAGIVATELESDTLQGLRARLHDLLAGRDRASK